MILFLDRLFILVYTKYFLKNGQYTRTLSKIPGNKFWVLTNVKSYPNRRFSAFFMMLKTWSEGNETVVQSYFNRLVAQNISQDTVSKVEFSSELVLRNEITFKNSMWFSNPQSLSKSILMEKFKCWLKITGINFFNTSLEENLTLAM